MKANKVIGCVVATFLLSGCVENYVSLEVLGAKPWAIDVVGEVDGVPFGYCVLPEFGENVQRSQGWIDFAGDFYTFIQPFEIRNNMPANDTDVGRLDTNSVIFDQLVISYRGLPGQENITDRLADFDTAISMTAVIDSDGGILMAPLTLIPAFRGRAMQSALVPQPGDVETIIASFSLEGRTNAGRKISTGTIDFPITIGNQSTICDDGRCSCYIHQD